MKNKFEIEIRRLCRNCENKDTDNCPDEKSYCYKIMEIVRENDLSKLVYENNGRIIY